MAITKDQIFAVADQIKEEGQTPTLAMVRKLLGGGSYTTISESMNQWKAKQAALSIPVREPIPLSLEDSGKEFLNEVWSVAIELSNARLHAEREAMERLRMELEQEKAEAVELADQLNLELDALKMINDSNVENLNQSINDTIMAKQEIQELTLKNTRQEASIYELTERVKDYKQDNKHLMDSVNDKSERLTSMSYVNENLTAEIERLQAVEQSYQVLTADAEKLRVEVERLRSVEQVYQVLTADAEKLRVEVERLRIYEIESAKKDATIEQMKLHTAKQADTFEKALLGFAKASAPKKDTK